MRKFLAAWAILKETIKEWQKDKAPRLGAALAFYTVLSIGPLLLIVIAIAGLAYGEEAVGGHLVAQIEGLVGYEGARAIQSVIANSSGKEEGITATLIGFATLLFGATGVFLHLQDALNTIWNVKPSPKSGWKSLVIGRLISFAMVLCIGFLLLVSLVISAGIAAMENFFGAYSADFLPLVQLVNSAISFGVVTLLFALIYKILPDTEIRWRDVWFGAAVTALLFTIGKYGIGLYLGKSSVGSAYGAAGSLIVVLVWVYYSAQILFFGAELTQVYARRRQGIAKESAA